MLALALLALICFPFPPVNKWIVGTALATLIGWVGLLRLRPWPVPGLLTASVLLVLWINVFLDTGFYPALLQYQVGVKVSELIREWHVPADRVYLYRIDGERSLDFYSDHAFVHIGSIDSLPSQDYLLTSKPGFDALPKDKFILLYSGQNFHVSTLSGAFLNPQTRPQEIIPYFIVQKR